MVANIPFVSHGSEIVNNQLLGVQQYEGITELLKKKNSGFLE
jgi:hypothetical protein